MKRRLKNFTRLTGGVPPVSAAGRQPLDSDEPSLWRRKRLDFLVQEIVAEAAWLNSPLASASRSSSNWNTAVLTGDRIWPVFYNTDRSIFQKSILKIWVHLWWTASIFLYTSFLTVCEEDADLRGQRSVDGKRRIAIYYRCNTDVKLHSHNTCCMRLNM